MKYVDTLASLRVDVEGEFYKSSIERLRSRLGLDSDNIPSLSSEAEEEEFFKIELFAARHCVTLMIRKRNMYLVGFYSGNQCKWLQFGSKSTTKHHLMDAYRAEFMGFDGGYDSLESVCGESRANIRLGKKSLMEAVQKLSTNNKAEVRAWFLIVVIQMICGAIQFPDICNFLADHYTDRRGVLPDNWMLELELDHQLPLTKYGLDLQAEDEDSDFEEDNCRDADPPKHDPNFYCQRCRGSFCIKDPQGMLEVFSVNIKGEDPDMVYGTIMVNDSNGRHFIYNREWGNPEPVNPHETILLTGPAYSMFAIDDISISFNLMKMDEGGSSLAHHYSYVSTVVRDLIKIEKRKKKSVLNIDRDPMKKKQKQEEENDEGGPTLPFEYQFEYDADRDLRRPLPRNQPLYANIDGKFVSAMMCYALVSDATSATVQVKFIKRKGLGEGEEKQAAKVYGLLAAEFSDFTDCESLLFRIRKESSEYVEVSPGQLIPLSRSAVALRVHSDLIVRADLYDYDSNDEIVKGSATFPGDFRDSSHMNISGKYGEIEVKVNWSSY